MEKTLSREEYNEQRKQNVEDKKLQIIDAAQKLFLTKGLDSVTMGDIMAATNTSRASMYRYFPSIHPIAFEVQYRMLKEIFGDLKRARFDTQKPKEQVKEGLITLVDNFHQHIEAYNYISMFDYFYAESYPDEKLSSDYLSFLGHLMFDEEPEHEEIGEYSDLVVTADVIFSYLQKIAHEQSKKPQATGYTHDLLLIRQMIDRIF